MAYFTAIVRQKNLPGGITENLQAYFSLGAVMDGLNNLFKDLFNVNLSLEEPKSGELWNDSVYKLAGGYY